MERIFDWTARLLVCYYGGVNNFGDFSNEKNCTIDNFVVEFLNALFRR